MELLQIALGIIFVIVLFSVLTSNIMDVLNNLLGLRGKQVKQVVTSMIGDNYTQQLQNHPYFEQISSGSSSDIYSKKGRFPSSLDDKTFTIIFMDLLHLHENPAEKIAAIPDGKTKTMLSFIQKQSRDNPEKLKDGIEKWYCSVMDRATGAFKRSTQIRLLGIGLFMAILFNADLIKIYQTLSVNPALRSALTSAASNQFSSSSFNSQMMPGGVNALNSPNQPQIGNSLQDVAAFSGQFESLKSPLGIGWGESTIKEMSTGGSWTWLSKIVGWLILALAVSLGASFWFDLLRKIINGTAGGGMQTAYMMGPQMPMAPGGSSPFPDPGVLNTPMTQTPQYGPDTWNNQSAPPPPPPPPMNTPFPLTLPSTPMQTAVNGSYTPTPPPLPDLGHH